MKKILYKSATIVCLSVTTIASVICIRNIFYPNKPQRAISPSSSTDCISSKKPNSQSQDKKGLTSSQRNCFSNEIKTYILGDKIAYLTFDDGPSQNTPLLLQTLQKANVRATFFVVGTNCLRYPNEVKEEMSAGNKVGIHSWTHEYSYIYSSSANFMQDFNRLRVYLTQQLGTAPDICRFPGGTNNTVSLQYNKNHIMQQIVRQVESMNIRPIDWNVSAEDAEIPVPSSSLIVNRIMHQIGNDSQPVILMHDSGNHTSTIYAVPEIVRQLKLRGYSFGTLSAATQAVMFPPS